MGRGGTACAVTSVNEGRGPRELDELTNSSPKLGVLVLFVLGKYYLVKLGITEVVRL